MLDIEDISIIQHDSELRYLFSLVLPVESVSQLRCRHQFAWLTGLGGLSLCVEVRREERGAQPPGDLGRGVTQPRDAPHHRHC